MKDSYIEDFISGQEVKATPRRVTLRHQTVSHAFTEFVSYTALCLFSGGKIGFGYIIFNEFVLKCCAGYPQYL